MKEYQFKFRDGYDGVDFSGLDVREEQREMIEVALKNARERQLGSMTWKQFACSIGNHPYNWSDANNGMCPDCKAVVLRVQVDEC